MSLSARKSAATAALLRHIDSRSTGCLRAGAGAAELRVYMLGGKIVGAEAQDDVRHLVRLAHLRGGIDLGTHLRLDAKIENAKPVFGDLLDLAPQKLIDGMLADRFQQNLASYLGSLNKPVYEAMRGIFIDSLQMGHDSLQLIGECCELWDHASSLDLDAQIVLGEVQGSRKSKQRIVAAFLSSTPRTVSSLLHELPMETLRARRLILEMLEQGTAMTPEEDDVGVDDVPTMWATRPGPAPSERAAESSAPAPASDDEDARVTLASDGGTEQSGALDDDEVAVETEEDNGPSEPEQETPAPAPSTGFSSLNAWLSSATVVDDEELDFFSDHDYERGAGDEGAFSTESHNLETVEVGDMMAPDVLEAEEAPGARFSAPVLSEDDAVGKITVTNEVLSAVVRAFDAIEGTGRGQAIVQLLVDGSPSRFAALLQNVEVSSAGHLPADDILGNLYVRPPTEHRQLINQTLVDIIERALSSAADELPDESFDQVLEDVAGYRQRLGL